MSGKQLTLFVTCKIKATQIDAFEEAHRPVRAACAQESEYLYFDVFQDPTDPGEFRFVAVWSKERKWLERGQLTKPYYVTLWPKSEPTWEEPPKLEYFEREREVCLYNDVFGVGEEDGLRRAS